ACDPPERLQYAELEESFRPIKSFPVGTVVTFVCRPGYMRIPGTSATSTCLPNLEWSPMEKFCTEKVCKHPGDLAHGTVHVTDLKFGTTATFTCEQGYRLRGADEITCVVSGAGVDWDKPLPYCEIIPCEPPPSIANGQYSEEESYVYMTTVIYRCDEVPKGQPPFFLIGSSTLTCISDEESNGVWSGPPPQCKVIQCENPRVENGRKVAGFGPSYFYRDSVIFECNPGYAMVGSNAITCEENSTWVPPEPTCETIGAEQCEAPKISNGVVIPVKSLYEKGESVQLKCNAQCAFPDGTGEMTATCQGQSQWSSLQNCICKGEEGSGSTPHISYGRVIEGQKPSYSVGDFITIECYAGYTLHGAARIQYVGENQWDPAVPTCKLISLFILPQVFMVVVVLLAAFWVYKKFFSQNG
ncbi:C4b-binding protein alpha chain, partial [Acanthisitta chloris]